LNGGHVRASFLVIHCSEWKLAPPTDTVYALH
jgi:hypothetical protein